MGEITNYWRFYASLNKMPYTGDREEQKRDLVRQYTGGRTESLREMSREEYDSCCAALERATGYRDKLRRGRSVCLRLMGQLGVNTCDWSRVDLFCKDRRIAGKAFARLTPEELGALERKLRAIKNKGGLRQAAPRPVPNVGAVRVAYTFDLSGAGEC